MRPRVCGMVTKLSGVVATMTVKPGESAELRSGEKPAGSPIYPSYPGPEDGA